MAETRTSWRPRDAGGARDHLPHAVHPLLWRALQRELTANLRTRRTMRQPGNHNRARGTGKGQPVDIVHISQRPAEAEHRAVPGHWEGDLIFGKGTSSIGTLVERSTRFVMLFKPDGNKSEQVIAALREQVLTLPDQLMRSLTWDQNKEMAPHANFTIDTGIQIYFCDPRSPWQRGSNETNGLLRQYFPRGTDLKPYTQNDLNAVAAEINGRPRKTLQFMTPSEKFAEAVAATPWARRLVIARFERNGFPAGPQLTSAASRTSTCSGHPLTAIGC